ncbi:MAG TPA: c-type cytochrome [Gemmatimonadaceae bacterium]|nr:c-type cytochrome [Gemmatimonadaceae bacterium]
MLARTRQIAWALVLAALSTLGACRTSPSATESLAESASVERGRTLVSDNGCGACHAIGGVPHANGMIGPPLNGLGVRSYIAGVLPNTPENLAAWVRSPQSFKPGSGMPNLSLSKSEAADVAAFLYTRY